MSDPACASPSRTQRWRDRRQSFVPGGSVFDPAEFTVDVIPCAKVAKPFVEAHHYSGTFPATRLSVGLFRNGAGGRADLVGVCAFSVPVNNASVLKHTGLEDPLAGVDLGRLVLLDDVAGNAESWFVTRAFRELRRAKPGVVSVVAYSDPVPRVSVTGEIVLPGHVGTVYRALSANFRGRSSRRTDLILPSGKAFSPRAASKLRAGEVGADYAERQLLEEGAPSRGGRAAADWLKAITEQGFLRKSRHPGNLVFSFALTRAAKIAAKRLPEAA